MALHTELGVAPVSVVAIAGLAVTSLFSPRGGVIRGIRALCVLQLLSFAALAAYSHVGPWAAPSEAHLAERKLAPLDGRPCCVRSGSEHAHIPFPRAADGLASAQAAVREAILRGHLRAPHGYAKLVSERALDERFAYAHYAFNIGLFRFVDDVELLFDGRERVIHFRSALRVGQGDMGANEDRMLALREALEVPSAP